MNGPRLTCNGCGKITDSLFKPLCERCDAEFHLNPTDEEVNRLMVRLAIGKRKPEFGRDWWLGVDVAAER